jgi:hypothetical protein
VTLHHVGEFGGNLGSPLLGRLTGLAQPGRADGERLQ